MYHYYVYYPCPDIFDGYVTFVVSILMIGVLTAFIGDLASHLGCTVGLRDTVTAIAFVALGTSVPGKKKWRKSVMSCLYRKGRGKLVLLLLFRQFY